MAPMKLHSYSVDLQWTGNDGLGTNSYKSYRRDYTIASEGKPKIEGSSDPAFRGDPKRYNPEEFLVASLSSCHMLWYLHLCSVNGVNVLDYGDQPTGVLREEPGGSGSFVHVDLHPRVTIAPGSDRTVATALHHDAHAMCFIARSVSFPVRVTPQITAADK